MTRLKSLVFLRYTHSFKMPVAKIASMDTSAEKPERDLRSRVYRNELILHYAGEGICGIDKDGKISFANPAAIEILGWNGESFVGLPYDQVFFGFNEDLTDDLVCTPIQFALLDGESSQVSSETFYRKDNSPVLVDYICVPLKEKNETIGAVVTFQDIAERSDIESAISEARDSALESARTKMAFLANMSHEIRTPLNGIIGMSALLANTKLQPDQLLYANVIKSSAQFLLEIVNEILDFSKIEAGKLQLETTQFDLQVLLAGVIEFFKPEAKKKGLGLKLEIAESTSFEILGDSNRLRQVLSNLISNAIKFTDNGEIVLRVNFERVADSLFVKFSVSDSGIGIAKERQEVLFEPFVQADLSTTRKFGGTGLGLAISKQIVSMMGGEIGVESEIGQGSAFWFSVSFEIAKNRTRSQKIETAPTDFIQPQGFFGEDGNTFPKMSVLIAEDNEINQQVAVGILKTFLLDVDIAKNGLEAIEMCKSRKYDLILMDCQMPEMDGFEATREIRRAENGLSKTPIIAMTASVLAIEQEKCIESGMDAFLGKPFSRLDIENMLAKYLKPETKKLDSKPSFVRQCLGEILEENALNDLISIEEGGEANFVNETLDLYFQHADLTIQAIEVSLREKAAVDLEEKAHLLRGSSGSVGLLSIFRLCADLENTAASRDWINLDKLFKDLVLEYERSKQAIADLTRVK